MSLVADAARAAGEAGTRTGEVEAVVRAVRHALLQDCDAIADHLEEGTSGGLASSMAVENTILVTFDKLAPGIWG